MIFTSVSYTHLDVYKRQLQRHGKRILVQNPPAKPLTTEEMDHVYALPYMRNYHPSYEAVSYTHLDHREELLSRRDLSEPQARHIPFDRKRGFDRDSFSAPQDLSLIHI